MFLSLYRGFWRITSLIIIGIIIISISTPFARFIDVPEVSPSIWYMGWAFIVAAIVDIVRRIMMPSIDFQKTAEEAQKGNIGAGLVLLSTGIFLSAFVIAAAGLVSQ